jgi:hypothetical protein
MNDQAATVQKNGGDESALHMGVAIAHFIQKFFPGVCSWRGAKMLQPRRKPSEFRTNFQRLASGSKKGATSAASSTKLTNPRPETKCLPQRTLKACRGDHVRTGLASRRCREGIGNAIRSKHLR